MFKLIDRRKFISLLVSLSTLLLNGCQATFFATVNGIRGNGDSERITEVIDSASGIAVDVYRPASATADTPVVIFYYGGSWRSGERGWYQFVGRALAAEGMVAVLPDYRKFPQVSFAELMNDAALAVRWVADHRERVGSEGPIFVAGHSAGAHIAALLATDDRYLRQVGQRPDAIAGLVGFAGPYNFLPIVDPAVAEVFVDEAGAYDAQPIHHVDRSDSPALLFHGSKDETVRPFNSATFAAALVKAGVRAEYREIPGMGHVRLVFEIGSGSETGRGIARSVSAFVHGQSEALAGAAVDQRASQPAD